MGKKDETKPKFTVILDKPAYLLGDTVKGTVYLEAIQDVDLSELYIRARGAEIVQWREVWAGQESGDPSGHKTEQRKVKNTSIFFEKQLEFGDTPATAGSKHAFPFEFSLPLASSAERKMGSSFTMDSTHGNHWAFNPKKTFKSTISAKPDFLADEIDGPKEYCTVCGNKQKANGQCKKKCGADFVSQQTFYRRDERNQDTPRKTVGAGAQQIQAKVEYAIKICQHGVDDLEEIGGLAQGATKMLSKEGRKNVGKNLVQGAKGVFSSDFKDDPLATVFTVYNVDPATLSQPSDTATATAPVKRCCGCSNKGDVSVTGTISAAYFHPGSEGSSLVVVTNNSSVKVKPAVELTHTIRFGETKAERESRELNKAERLAEEAAAAAEEAEETKKAAMKEGLVMGAEMLAEQLGGVAAEVMGAIGEVGDLLGGLEELKGGGPLGAAIKTARGNDNPGPPGVINGSITMKVGQSAEFVGPGETKTVEIQWKLPAELPAMTLSDLVKSTYSMNLVVESAELELPFPVFPLPTEFTADDTSFPAVESASAMEDTVRCSTSKVQIEYDRDKPVQTIGAAP